MKVLSNKSTTSNQYEQHPTNTNNIKTYSTKNNIRPLRVSTSQTETILNYPKCLTPQAKSQPQSPGQKPKQIQPPCLWYRPHQRKSQAQPPGQKPAEFQTESLCYWPQDMKSQAQPPNQRPEQFLLPCLWYRPHQKKSETGNAVLIFQAYFSYPLF